MPGDTGTEIPDVCVYEFEALKIPKRCFAEREYREILEAGGIFWIPENLKKD